MHTILGILALIGLSILILLLLCGPIILCELCGYTCPYCCKVHVKGCLNNNNNDSES